MEVGSIMVGSVRLAGKVRVAYMCQRALVAPVVRVFVVDWDEVRRKGNL